MAKNRRDGNAPWDRDNPRKAAKAKGAKGAKTSKRLTPAQRAEAKARARHAGRPYPNLVDNMAVARKHKAGTSAKRAKKSAQTAKARKSAKGKKN